MNFSASVIKMKVLFPTITKREQSRFKMGKGTEDDREMREKYRENIMMTRTKASHTNINSYQSFYTDFSWSADLNLLSSSVVNFPKRSYTQKKSDIKFSIFNTYTHSMSDHYDEVWFHFLVYRNLYNVCISICTTVHLVCICASGQQQLTASGVYWGKKTQLKTVEIRHWIFHANLSTDKLQTMANKANTRMKLLT